MKRLLLLFAFVHVMCLLYAADPLTENNNRYAAGPITDGFITQWVTTKDAQQIIIPITPLLASQYNYDVNWGDGSNSTGQTGDATHTYTSKGTYTVTIKGEFPGIQFNSNSSPASNDSLIHAVLQWGNGTWEGMDAAFMNCVNLVTVPNADGPIFAPNATLYCMFLNCYSFNGDLDKWDVSNVRETANMFQNATSFNGNISTWDVHNVTNMQYMFSNANHFNGDLSSWNVANVQYFQSMFAYATAFNGDLSTWNTGSATTMQQMFGNAIAFNADISHWDVSSVTEMELMFNGARNFNQNLSAWDVSKVVDMSNMFTSAVSFNGDIAAWDVHSVKTTSGMFQNAAAFNRDLPNWDLSSDTTMELMFYQATSFNGNISNWKVNNVKSMSNTFGFATSFNQSIDGWNVSNVENMSLMFFGALKFNQDLNNWNVSKVTNMYEMFRNATAFNGDISLWDVSSVTDMSAMFSLTGFNRDITNWNTQAVQTLSQMFMDNSSFNQDISGWNVASVMVMADAFNGATSFNQNLGSWDIEKVTSMNQLFDNSGLSTANYEATLNGWALQDVKSDVSLGATGIKYCDNTGHDELTDTHSWTINGDRQVCLVPAVPDADGIVYVDSTAAANGDGSNWKKALRYLSNATESARENTAIKEVHIAKGTYYPTGQQNAKYQDSTFIISRSNLKLLGGYPNGGGVRNTETNGTILSGDIGVQEDYTDNVGCVLSIQNIPETDSLLVDGLTIANGNITPANFKEDYSRIASGVTILNSFANTVLNHCKIVDNHSVFCSGIAVISYSEQGDGDNLKLADPQILNCLIQHNKVILDADQANYGYEYGSSFWNANAKPYVYNCSFLENQGFIGGANFSYYNGAPLFNKCRFTGNTAYGISVSVSLYNSSPKFINCLINNNIVLGLSELLGEEDEDAYKIYDNAIVANLMYSNSSLVNCTVVNNKSAVTPVTDAGLIFNSMQSNVNITNSVFWGNQNHTITDSLTNLPSAVSYSLIEGVAADASNHLLDGTVNQAVFTDSANGDYSLVAGSEVIDAGFNDSLKILLGTHLDGMTDGGTDLASNQRILNDVIDLGAFELLGGNLPVNASDLSGQVDASGQVILNWTTYTESNNKGFRIQKSMDGINFQDLDFVASQAYNGVSSSALDYSFRAGLLDGTAYYRFVQEDQNGTKKSSNVIRLINNLLEFKVQAYPNPVQNTLQVKIIGKRSANAGLTLLNFAGKVLRRQPVTGAQTKIDMQGLAAGIYLLRYKDNANTTVIKVIKQ
ncbi:Por secretion system C-terminal sorting domain-containing protein [Arachidicoccus rhizosphaerae]|uniref:Por secretion system C-terminal sorting domain-containing protein n=1 Tax=Arachidicoccus rhizosphaerae TaxID=551991 RepID=A0A1H3W7A1_9BACT|nr:BspA family leucine-rich repeat surface protein [Arachidicoccus rhizosphaerae]SDZ82870.1 Por secretion system C-terminal sorting domain-containing protein [Arachidicoccus rhizosphaerae]